ncbi:unnamed protein product [Closterium sp. NIES-54]
MVTTTTPGGQRVSICTCTRTGRHLATFTRRPGSSLYRLATEPPQVAASAQVSASGQVAASCSCRLLSHQTLLWHHRLGHPSLPRLCGMHSRVLVSSLPRSLPPLPPSPAPPCLPCVEGRQRAAPHSSSFPLMTAPLQTLHMDVWGPARVSGQGRERFFLLVVDDYTRYTTVFPLCSKGEVTYVLIPWIRTVRLQLRERFGTDLLVLRLHSDRGGEFSSDLLRDFCRGEGILHSFTLPDSPQQNGIAERRIGLVMELNLWPRVSLPETSPTLRWTGKVGDASVFRVGGSRAFVRDTSTDKLSARAIPCVFLGFVPDAPGWQFYHPTSHRVFPSQDVTFDESVPFYRLFPYRSAPPPPPPIFLAPGPPPVAPLPPQGPAPLGVSQVDPLPGPAPLQVALGSGVALGAASGGAAFGGEESGGAGSEGVGFGGAEPGGAEPKGVESGGAESEGAESGGATPRGAASSGGAGVTTGARSPGGTATTSPGGARTSGAGAAGTGGVGCPGAGEPIEPGAAGTGGAGAAGVGVGGPSAGGAGAAGAGVGGTGIRDARGAGAGAVDPGTGGTPASPLPAPSPYTEKSGGLTERHEPASRPILPVRTARRAPRSRPPPVPGTHVMALHPSSIPLHVPLPTPPESSVLEVLDPASDSARAANPTVSRLLATAVTDPSFESDAASALVAELLDFIAACRLDYATALVAESTSASPPSVGGECTLGTDVLEDRQEDFECLAATVPRFASMLLAPERDPDAPDIPTPRSYAEAITGPYSSQWQAAMDAKMASWKSTGTYVNEVPPPGASIVDGMWIFRVKRPPGSPPAFKARYVARGLIQRQGVDYFETFSPTPKMTTLRGSLHEEIWLRRPRGFTGTFPADTEWSLRRPVYGLRQAPREWHDTLRTTLVALEFTPFTADPSLFLRTDTSPPPFYVLVTSGMGLVLGGRGPVVLTGHADASWELCWLTYLLTDLGEQPSSPPVLYVDNRAMIALCQEHGLEHKTKHIALRYFLARELQQRGQLCLAYVATRANTADDFTKALSPVSRHTSLRILLAIGAVNQKKLWQINVANAFLYAPVDAEIFDKLPHGSNTDPNQVCQLEKSLYGIKQAQRLWQQHLHARLIRIGFLQLPHDQGMYRLTKGTDYILLIVYVDDLLYIGSTDAITTWFEGELQRDLTLTVTTTNVTIFDLDFDAILAAMYALSDSAEGDCYLSVPPDPGIAAAALGTSASAPPRTGASAAPGAGASSSLFTPGGQRVTHCTSSRTGRHLATFTRRPGSSLYTLTTAPPPVSASGQVAASSQVFAAASRSSMASRTLVSGIPRSLPPLPPGPAPTCVPCVEGRQRAAPHSSMFPPTEAPLQTLHMDVWGPARVRGQGHERYFLLVVDDYSHYTTVFPLRSKGEVPEVLIDWICGTRRRLRESFGSDLHVLRLHSDRGGEFSSDLLRAFCRAEGIRQTYTLPASPQQNGIAERRIGMVMDVARTSMIYAAAPHFLWPFAVQYAAHQINLQPRVSLPETTPTLRWTGKVADKLTSRAVPCVFLGFPPDAPGWQFYHPTSIRVLSSQDVTFDESVSYYHTLPPQVPSPSGVSQVDPAEPVKVAVDSGAARGAEPVGARTGGAGTGGAEPECVEPGGAESGGAKFGRAEPGSVEFAGTASRSAEPARAEPGGALGVPSRREPLSPQRLREWYSRRCRGATGAAGTGAAGVAGGDTGAAGGSAGAGAAGAAGGAAGAGAAGGAARATGGAAGAGAAGAARGAAGAGAAGGAAGAAGGAVGAAGGGALAGAVGGAAGTGGAARVVAGDSRRCAAAAPASPLPGPSPYTGPTRGLTERREPESRHVSPESRSASTERTVRAGRVSRPPVPGTHSMTLPDRRFLATAVSDPLFESTAASALVTELVDFGAACRLDYATSPVAESASASVCPPSVGGECALSTDVLEDRQEEFEFFAAAVTHLAAMDAEMASWKSTGTYVDEVPPPEANIVSGMWIFRVKRPPGSPPALKARYVARGFNDLVFAIADTVALAHVKSELQKSHTCTDLGELTSYLGLRITRDRAQRTITLTQSHMVQQVLQRFGFTYSSPQSTPLPTGHSLLAPPSDESVDSSGPYPELVGCLMYLMTCTRPDLAYPLSLLARYVAPGRHQKVHWDAAKRVLRCLCSTTGMGLVLGGWARVVLTGHADTSWVDDLATQRSSHGYTFSFVSGSVSWRSTHSSSVLSSSCEAEIYAGAMAAQELRWLTYLLTDLGEAPRSSPVLYVDNNAMLALCQEHRLEHRTKDIALRYFLARELQQCGQLRLAYVASQANTANDFTKALQPCDHQRFCTVLGLVPTVPHLLSS